MSLCSESAVILHIILSSFPGFPHPPYRFPGQWSLPLSSFLPVNAFFSSYIKCFPSFSSPSHICPFFLSSFIYEYILHRSAFSLLILLNYQDGQNESLKIANLSFCGMLSYALSWPGLGSSLVSLW